jgi:CubicO group peptidase (beta-lactamase class C family)
MLIVAAIFGLPHYALAGPTTAPIDISAFEQFADQQMKDSLAHGDFPGAAIELVQNDKVVFERGYGVTSLDSRAPVDPQQTRFRMGSISKVFTTVAVLQLVEQGKISLDDPIQKLLPDLPLGPAGDGVLIRHLLTHTDGFDVGWSIGSAAIEPAPAMTLTQFLQSHLPQRIFMPGQMYVYSDVGMTIAGHIIEDVSGKPFEQYIDDEIFSPLAMTHSTFRQPPPGEDGTKLAQGYRDFRDQLHPVPLLRVRAVPAAGLTITPADMARFMRVYLREGELDGQRILQPQTARLMQEQQFTHHPALPGTAFGLYERIENGQRALQHGGVMPGFHSQILFIPAQNLGLFITTNAYGGGSFDDFTHTFFNQFFTKSQATTQPASVPASLPPDRADLSGRYRYVQYPHLSIGKLCVFSGLVEEMRVRQQSDGSIIVDQGLMGPFAHIGPLLYARGTEKIAFRVDANGKAVSAAYDTWAFEKIHWYEGRRAQLVLGGGLLAVFLLTAITLPIARSRRRRRQPHPQLGAPRCPDLCRDLAAIACAGNVIFLSGMIYSLLSADVFTWFHGLPHLVTVLLYLPWIDIALFVAALICTLCSLRKSWTLLSASAHLIALAGLLIFPLFCWYWNLLVLPGRLPG